MKKLLLIILLCGSFVYGQGVTAIPLTQQEYVRFLYEIERAPRKLPELVQAVRSRGIGFEFNRGLRSLTKSKTGNDDDLLRAIEEANRRRKDPSSAKRPSSAEAKSLLEKARANTLASLDEMPDFVVKQRIRRSLSVAGTNNFRGLDRLIVAVSYRADGREEYRLLSKNGVQNASPGQKSSYSEAGGTSSTGEFVTVLATVFKPGSMTRFEFVDTDLLRNRKTLVFDFSIDREKARQQITSYGYVADSTISGMSGRIWIDRVKARVIRLDSKATQIPIGFPVTAASRVIDYDWVNISEEDYLLPISSDVRLTFREPKRSYESKNFIEFKDYQKYGTEVVILDDDTEFIEDPEAKTDPNAPPPLKIKPKPDN
ncbi:MAG: hypothetical protein HKN33_08525 [Pyrinomonadaceae bacterium]|nr:hypothetical protein [Pyrinomonadaceae bacterium]